MYKHTQSRFEYFKNLKVSLKYNVKYTRLQIHIHSQTQKCLSVCQPYKGISSLLLWSLYKCLVPCSTSNLKRFNQPNKPKLPAGHSLVLWGETRRRVSTVYVTATLNVAMFSAASVKSNGVIFWGQCCLSYVWIVWARLLNFILQIFCLTTVYHPNYVKLQKCHKALGRINNVLCRPHL